MIGTNNVGNTPPQGSDDAMVEDVAKGIKAILSCIPSETTTLCAWMDLA